MKRFYLSKLIVLIAIWLVWSCGAFAQVSTFTYTTGVVQNYVVPAGVNLIGVDMYGAAGGNISTYIGGLGGRVQCTMNVTPLTTLYVYVGQKGPNGSGSFGAAPAGGNNSGGGADGGSGSNGDGGGSGGGSTDIRTISGNTPAALSSRLVVAAGGGGAGWDCGEAGGVGGGLTGGTGTACGAYNAAMEGGPGTQSNAGAAGFYNFFGTNYMGTAGAFGKGGNADNNFWGGGGGGGWYGAGGSANGSGCGGSSYYGSPGIITANTTPGYASANANGHVTITVLCSVPGTIVGNNTMCTGSTTTLTNPTAVSPIGPGTWTSSNPAVATIGSANGVVTGVSSGTTIITYNVSNTCSGAPLATFVMAVNQTPTVTTGSLTACTGLPTTLAATPAGGVWTSSNTAVATTSGNIVTGAGTGTASIVYTISGCTVANPLTVNLSPALNAVINGGGYCNLGPGSGVHIGLNGSSTGVSYKLYNGGALAGTLPGSGLPLDFGVISTPGSYSVQATSLAGCTVSMSGAVNVFINPNPAVSGAGSVCAGATTVFTSGTFGGTWTVSDIAKATVNPSTGAVSGLAAGAVNITYTIPGGCYTSTPLVINPTPSAITGASGVCTGATTTLSSSTTGGTWTSSNTSVATAGIGTGTVSGVTAGNVNISYTIASGCFVTKPVAVNLLPVVYPVTGSGNYCTGIGGHVGLPFANAGINYQLYDDAGFVTTMAGANSALDFGLQTVSGTYTVFASNFATGCGQPMSGSAVVTIRPLPNSSYTVGGGGNYCSGGAGSHVTLSGSEFGTTYQLFNGSAAGSMLAGTSGSLNFGPQTAPGNYTIMGTTVFGCTGTMTGSAAVGINSSPVIHSLTGGGSYCAGGTGVDLMLDGSDTGISYQLFKGLTGAGTAVSGTGSAIDFGMQTGAGNYTVIATSTSTACSQTMAGIPAVTIGALPTPYTITGGGGICEEGSGVDIGLNFSDPGVSYQLYRASVAVGGAVLPGATASLDFGLQNVPGAYTIVATNTLTNCMSNMIGAAMVTLNTPPAAFNVTGGGTFCIGGTGEHVGLGGSSLGIHYQLYNGTPVGITLTGAGSALDFGSRTIPGNYTVVATDPATGCTATMPGTAAILAIPQPTPFSVGTVGPASYCPGSSGVDIIMTSSDVDATYQLFRGGVAVGSSVPGDGIEIGVGLSTAGVYTVVASNAGCSANMPGSVNVTIAPVPTVYTVTGGGNYCIGSPGARIGLSGSATSTVYQLYNSGIGLIGAAIGGTGSTIDFGYQAASGGYTVVARNAAGCTSNMAGSAVVTPSSLPGVYVVSGDGGSYCAGGAGSAVGLSGSASGVKYQVYNGALAIGSPVTGSGSPLSLGLHSSGTYIVIATNATTSCMDTMTGTATIIANPLPTAYAVTGGGNVCSAGTGAAIGLSASDGDVNYQLYNGITPVGPIASGTGSALNFGTFTGGGTYTVQAIDATSHCTSNMTGAATINAITSPPVNTVTGGGTFCAGGAGLHVGLDGTGSGLTYQLYNTGVAVGSPVIGTGFAQDFGLQTIGGTYTVTASVGGLCPTAMASGAPIIAAPLPLVFNITGGGIVCPGDTVRLGLDSSNSGIRYDLYHGTTRVDTVDGVTGAIIDFGQYTMIGAYSVIAIDKITGCTDSMSGSGIIAVTTAPPPTIYVVAGGGEYCAGGIGLHIYLNGSTTDVNYQLYNNWALTGSPIGGTGSAFDFGLETAAGHYTVTAKDAYTGCSDTMNDAAIIAIDPILTPAVTITGPPGLTIPKGQLTTLTANTGTSAGASPSYQWYINGLPVTGATGSTYSSASFANHDSISCEVVSSGLCGGQTGSASIRLNVISNAGVQQVGASGSNIMLVPNPNNGEFTIKGTLGIAQVAIGSDEEVSMEITDMIGHVVYNAKIMARNGSINEKVQLSGALANGMYIVSLRSASDYQIFHIVIGQ